MPSDERVAEAMAGMSGRFNAFRSALATTLEELRGLMADYRPSEDGRVERLGGELGHFAEGRIDLERFSSFVSTASKSDGATIEPVEDAFQTLTTLISQKEALFLVKLKRSGELHRTVAKALANLGRAFGAARAVELSKRNLYQASEHKKFHESFPQSRWNEAERTIAPPLVVRVEGSDLHVAGLAEFLDGSQKLVLVVRGDAPPAPLVRLITPGTYVVQSTGVDALERLAEWDGPAIAALMPESAAQFVHDPSGGSELADRLSVTYLPTDEPRKPLGSITASQQAEDLRQLKSLAATTARVSIPGGREERVPTAAGQPPTSDPADKLAAWLLSQADLSDVA